MSFVRHFIPLVVVPHRHYCHYYHHIIIALVSYSNSCRCVVLFINIVILFTVIITALPPSGLLVCNTGIMYHQYYYNTHKQSHFVRWQPIIPILSIVIVAVSIKSSTVIMVTNITEDSLPRLLSSKLWKLLIVMYNVYVPLIHRARWESYLTISKFSGRFRGHFLAL